MKCKSVFLCMLTLAMAVACGSTDEDTGHAAAGGTAGAGGGATGGVAGSATGGASGSGGSADAGVLGVSLPQAVDGALLASPLVYAAVPLHMAVTGNPDAVEVDFAGKTLVATDPEKDGTWTAQLAIGSLADGVQKLTARAKRAGATPVSVDAELVLAKNGVQLTDHAKVGLAATPRLHRRPDGGLWLTWRDRSAQSAGIYLRRLDGGGRAQGAPVTLMEPSVNALYARTAFGTSGVGILYQTLGSPYVNHFKVVDPSGKELVAPIDLDGSGFYGNSGGDIAFDGTGWVFVWRATDGTKQELRWARVEEGSGKLSGPLVVATSGNDDPHGKFPGFVPVGVRSIAGKSLVSFVRERWDNLLTMPIPKSQIASVSSAGALESTEYAGKEADFTFHHEARVFAAKDSLIAIWSANDLNSTDPNPPNLFFATRTDAQGKLDPKRGAGVKMVDAPDDRGEPFFISHPVHLGLLAWLDHRSYTQTSSGKIELYAAPVKDDLSTGAPTVVSHARFIAGSSDVNGVLAGSNAVLTWVDERHGGGVLDPRAEIWLDTVWY